MPPKVFGVQPLITALAKLASLGALTGREGALGGLH